MAEAVVIEGWECAVSQWDIGDVRAARSGGKLVCYCPGDGSLECTADVPPAVLSWLIRPLLAEEWEAGWNQAMDELRGASQTKPNPHTDPTPTEGEG